MVASKFGGGLLGSACLAALQRTDISTIPQHISLIDVCAADLPQLVWHSFTGQQQSQQWRLLSHASCHML